MDPIEKAKKLIEKGKKTKNDQLIQLGEEILKKYAKPEHIENQFALKRTKDTARAVFDENGNQIGVKQRREPIKAGRNKFVDDRKEGKDKANEILKRFTKRSPRQRPASTTVVATCTSCGKQEQVNPIHTKISIYRCAECVRKLKY